MKLNRRSLIAGAAATSVMPTFAQNKPYAGKELKVLCVVATQFKAHEKRAAKFMEDTGAKITYTNVPFANMREALTAEMVGGTGGYDICVSMDAWNPSLNNLYEPLDGMIKAKGINLARYPKAFVDTGLVEGKQLGLPTRAHVQLLFYRKDLFAKHNLTPPATWEEMIETAKILQTKEQIAGLAVPYGKNNGQNLMVWYNLLWGKGGDLFDTKGLPTFNSPQGLAAAQDYVDWLQKHKITPPTAVAFNEQDAVNSMRGGNAAMLPVWWWVRGGLLDPKVSKLTEEQIGFVPMPSYKGAPRSTYINCWIYGVTKASKNKDAAMDYLNFICSPEVERSILVDAAENDVVCTQYANMRDEEVNKRYGGMHNFAADALQNTKVVKYSAEWPQISEALETAMSEAASGTKSVADAFNGAAATVTRIVKRG